MVDFRLGDGGQPSGALRCGKGTVRQQAAARVLRRAGYGVTAAATTILVFTLAGVMYGFTGFIEGARIGANTANTGLNYELDAIAACVIGGVSFVGGIGKIRGVIIGVVLLNLERLPGVLQSIFEGAFNPAAFTGGIIGSLFVSNVY